MASLVEIRDLRVEATTDAGRRLEIIKGVSLDVAEGEIVALIGESGSGKTTIALTLMGHTREGCRIAGGSVTVAGQDVARLSEARRAALRGAAVAYVPQSAAAAFNPAQTIMEQVIEVTRIHGLMNAAAARVRPSSCSARCRCRTLTRSGIAIPTRCRVASCSACRPPWR